MLENRCDVHTHTVASRHAYSTVDENVRAASERGVDLLGVTDHFSCMTSVGVQTDGTGADIRDYQSFLDTVVWPREWHGVTLLRGAEADIVDVQGTLFGHGIPMPNKIPGDPYPEPLDLETRILSDTDYAIASVHIKTFCSLATPAQNAAMYVHALEHPKVLILGHIGRLGIDFELDPVIEAARDLGKLIEINNSTVIASRSAVPSWAARFPWAPTRTSRTRLVASTRHSKCSRKSISPRNSLQRVAARRSWTQCALLVSSPRGVTRLSSKSVGTCCLFFENVPLQGTSISVMLQLTAAIPAPRL